MNAQDERTRSATPATGATVLKQRAYDSPDGLLSSVFRAANLADAKSDRSGLDGAARTEKKLALLLEVSKGLSRAVDVNALLDKITELVFQILDVDRVAIELVDARWRARADDLARPTGRRHRQGRSAIDRANGGRREGRGTLRQRAAGPALRRTVDSDAERALRNVRAADRHRGCRAGRALRRQHHDDASLQRGGPRVSHRVLEHRGGRAREQQVRRANQARDHGARATSSASSRRGSPRRSPARRTSSSSAATRALSPCCSATFAASPRSRNR